MTARGLRFGDLARLKLVSDPRLAPDGRLAFVQAWLDIAADRTRREVIVLDPLGHADQRVPAPEADTWCPRWSPDGDRLALIRSASASAEPALWWPGSSVLHLLAAIPGEATELEWSPDGRALAVTSVLRRGLGGGPAFAHPAGSARLDGHAGVISESRRIFVLAIDGSPGWEVMAGPGDGWHPRWSPDGTRLAFLARLPDETGSPSAAQLCLADVSMPAGPIVRLPGPAVSFAWSPSGRDLAYLGPRDGEQSDIDCRLFRRPADGSSLAVGGPAGDAASATELAGSWDRSLGSIVRADDARGSGPPPLLWSGATDRIYFPVANGGQGAIGWAAPGGDEHGTLVGGQRTCLDPSLDPAGPAIAFVSTEPADPGNVHLADLSSGQERQLTDLNSWLSGSLAPTRLVTIAGADGRGIEGWLTVPDHPLSEPCPLVVSVHGGPHYSVGWRFSFETQRLAARGYAVLSGNPRGSGGYGRGFAAAIRGAWGTPDWADLDRLIDAAAAQPSADADRIAITGISYGGYMTMRAITQTDRFSLAISENGISNLLALWGAGAEDIGWLTSEMDATPWERPEDYVARSPLAQAGKIRTPLLLIHGELDQNCPIAQSEQMLAALRQRGVVVELLRLDGEGHMVNLVGRPSRRLARASAVDQWLDRYLRPRPPADYE